MNNKTKKTNGILGGTIWTTLSFLVVTVVYLLRLSILTRYLDKADFGLVAIVLFVLGFTNIFADLGVSTSLLSQKKVSKKEYSSLYWGGLMLSFVLYGVISLSSPLFSYVYEHQELNYLIPIMGIDLIISSIGRQFSVFKQKELRFKELAIIKIVSETISLIVAVLLAINGYGIWSLIFSLLTTSSVNSLLNFILGYKSHPLIWHFNYNETKHLYRIGFFQTGSQILDYISSQIDILILGKLLPMSEMGVYSIIKTLVLRVYSSINQIITKVVIPYFNRMDYNTDEYKNKYINVVNLVSMINIICYFIIIINANSVLEIFYGKDYGQYEFILMILCIWGIFSSVINCTASIIVISTGRTDLGFKWTQYRLVLNPFFIVLGAYFGGVMGVAISQAIFSVLTIPLYSKIVISKILPNLSLVELLKEITRIIMLCFFMLPVFYFFNKFILSNLDNNYLVLFISSCLIIISFMVLIGKKVIISINNLKE